MKFLFYLLILLYIKYTTQQITFNLITPPNKLDVYEVTPGGGCQISFKYSITTQESGLVQDISGPGLVATSNQTNGFVNIITWYITITSNSLYTVTAITSQSTNTFNISVKCSVPPIESVQLIYINKNIKYSYGSNQYFGSFKLTGFSKYFAAYNTSTTNNAANVTLELIQLLDYSGSFDIIYQVTLKPVTYFTFFSKVDSFVVFYGKQFTFSFNAIPYLDSTPPDIKASTTTGSYSSCYVEFTQNYTSTQVRTNSFGGPMMFTYYSVLGNQTQSTMLAKGSFARSQTPTSFTVEFDAFDKLTNSIKLYSTLPTMTLTGSSSPTTSTTTCFNQMYTISVPVGQYRYFKLSNSYFNQLRPAPYGHFSGTLSTLQYLTNSVASKNFGYIGTFINDVSSSSCTFSSPIIDTLPPVIIGTPSIKRVSTKSPFWLVKFQFSDPTSGFAIVSFIRNSNKEYIVADNSHISVGNSNAGTVEFQLDSRKEEIFALKDYIIHDNGGSFVTITNNIYNNFLTIGNFTYFKFNQKTLYFNETITTTYIPSPTVPVTLFFNLTNRNDDIPISLCITKELYVDQTQYFSSYWDESFNMYRIDFQVNYNMFSQELYYQIITPTSIDNSIIEYNTIVSYFGSDAILNIEAKNADQMPPIVTNITYTITIDTDQILLMFLVTIEDMVNGIKNGTAKITSDYDAIGYEFFFGSTEFNSTFGMPVILKKSRCRNQIFTISYLKIEDRLGRIGIYDSMANQEIGINPLYRVLNNPNIKAQVTQCTAIDNIYPYISTISYSNPISVSQFDAVFTINDETGLFNGRYPKCYLTTTLERILEVTASCLYSPTYLSAECTCIFKLPFKFGYPDGYVLSIYNLVDEYMNFRGYIQNTLFAINNSIPSSVPFPSKQYQSPIINSIEPYYNDQTQITIHGYSLDQITNTIVRNSTFDILSVVSGLAMQNNIFIIVNLLQPLNISFYIQLSSVSGLSGLESITPLIPYIPETPPGKCLNNCGGKDQGTCTDKGCQCINPWIGDDCRSKVINTTNPTTNTTAPTTEQEYEEELPDGEKINLSTLISIVGMRELDFNDKLIKEYPFKTWTFTNISTSSEIKFLYSTNFSVTVGQGIPDYYTMINVTTQWFSSTKSITFAGETFQVYPSTMKYSVEISPFLFKSQLSKLQLIFSAKIQSNQEEVCSGKEFKQSTNTDIESEYLKLSLNTHSLYGRFIKRALVDQRITIINNEVIDSETELTPEISETLVAINIPHYNTSVLLDPDFSLLYDLSSAKDMENSICFEPKKGLSKAQLAGIIVGAVFGFIVLITVVCYFIYKNIQYSNWMLSMKEKMQKEKLDPNKKLTKLQRIRRSIAPVFIGNQIKDLDKF